MKTNQIPADKELKNMNTSFEVEQFGEGYAKHYEIVMHNHQQDRRLFFDDCVKEFKDYITKVF